MADEGSSSDDERAIAVTRYVCEDCIAGGRTSAGHLSFDSFRTSLLRKTRVSRSRAIRSSLADACCHA